MVAGRGGSDDPDDCDRKADGSNPTRVHYCVLG